MARVFDKSFVEKARYAELLVDEIPLKQRLDVFIEVFRAKRTGDGRKLSYFTQALYAKLTEEDRQEIHAMVADEISRSDEDDDFRLSIQMFSESVIAALPEVARLRLENRLIKSIREGRYDESRGKCKQGALGTWLEGRFPEMLLGDELERAISEKLMMNDFEHHAYLHKYLSGTLFKFANNPSSRLVIAFQRALEHGSQCAKDIIEMTCFPGKSQLSLKLSKELAVFQPSDPFPDGDIPF